MVEAVFHFSSRLRLDHTLCDKIISILREVIGSPLSIENAGFCGKNLFGDRL
jgi:hypothetical protein